MSAQSCKELQEARIGCLLLGFPKSGTTSFADWLGRSADISLSKPKETYFLCPEFRATHAPVGGKSLEATFFDESGSPVRLEATTLNAYSDSLLELVTSRSDVKCIITIREVLPSIISWHKQMQKAKFIGDMGLSEAWTEALTLQNDGVKSLHNYVWMMSFGEHTARWIAAVGHDRLLVVSNAELKKDAAGLSRRVNKFFGKDLKLPDAIPELNVYSERRFKLVYDVLTMPKIKASYYQLEKYVPGLTFCRRAFREKVFLKKTQKNNDIDPATLNSIKNTLAEDAELLQRCYQENLAHWGSK